METPHSAHSATNKFCNYFDIEHNSGKFSGDPIITIKGIIIEQSRRLRVKSLSQSWISNISSTLK